VKGGLKVRGDVTTVNKRAVEPSFLAARCLPEVDPGYMFKVLDAQG